MASGGPGGHVSSSALSRRAAPAPSPDAIPDMGPMSGVGAWVVVGLGASPHGLSVVEPMFDVVADPMSDNGPEEVW